MGPSRRIFKGPAEFRFETLEKRGGGDDNPFVMLLYGSFRVGCCCGLISQSDL